MIDKTRRPLLTALAVTAALCAGCAPEPEPVPLTDGPWRAVVELPGGELPFAVSFARDRNGALQATIANGSERVTVPEVIEGADEMTLAFPAFNNRIVLKRDARHWRGSLTLVKQGGVEQVMPMMLYPGQTHRFFEDGDDVSADFGGTWAVTFVDDDENSTPAVGEFTQRNARVTGTFRTPTGDYRFLAGDVRDRTLYLSTFDGAHAFVFVARQADNGEMRGDFWSGTKWHESFTGRRDASASLPDASGLSKLRDDVQRVAFTFPDTSGKPVSLSDPRFAGKVVIVALAGSWCPNCHDEAAFLAPFYREQRDRGLEIVGLMFEHLKDFEIAATQVDRFRAKFDIEYELLVAGFSDKSEATSTLGLLDKVIAYPTMIVLDRKGQVREVHTGFNGPGTGVHYDEFRARFGALIDQLLAEDNA